MGARYYAVTALVAQIGLAACTARTPAEIEEDAPEQGTYALGSVTINSGASIRDCPPGFDCVEFVSTCSQLARPMTGYAAVAEPSGTPRGVVVFFRGGSGTDWTFAGLQTRDAFADQLVSDGFRIVQVRWSRNWIEAEPSEDAGPAQLACHPASAVKWAHDRWFAPLNITRSDAGRCGFCVTGNSGGSSQTAFALTHYGLDSIIDAAVPTGGPPHGALAKACLRVPGEEEYWMGDDTRHFFDRGFGIHNGNGPCFRHDASFIARWNQESVNTGGSDYLHPRTRMHVLVGARDAGMQPYAEDYVARLRASGSSWVSYEVVPNTPHSIQGSVEGRAALRAALLSVRP